MSREDDDRPRYRRLDPAREAAREERDTPAVFRTQAFKDLSTEWDKILARDGFVDIEKPENSFAGLAELAFHQRYRANVDGRTADLYTLMEHWLSTNRWRTRRERQWFYAAMRGHNGREIHRTGLNVPEGTSAHRVSHVLRSLVDTMLEEWEAEEEVEA